MKLNEFFEEKGNYSSRKRNRTINVSDDIHSFYKKISSHYNVGISTIISNILVRWRDEHKEEIMEDIIKRLDKND